MGSHAGLKRISYYTIKFFEAGNCIAIKIGAVFSKMHSVSAFYAIE